MCRCEFCEYPASGQMTVSPPFRVGVGLQQSPTSRGSLPKRLLLGELRAVWRLPASAGFRQVISEQAPHLRW